MRIQDYTVQHDMTTASGQVLTRVAMRIQDYTVQHDTTTASGQVLTHALKPLLIEESRLNTY